jgi:hypothetical protein
VKGFCLLTLPAYLGGVLKKRQFKKGAKKAPKGISESLGAFILDRSGKSLS